MPHITEEALAELHAGDSSYRSEANALYGASYNQPPQNAKDQQTIYLDAITPTRIFFRLSEGSVVKLSAIDCVGPIIGLKLRSYPIAVGGISFDVSWDASDKDAKEHEQCHLSLLMALGVFE